MKILAVKGLNYQKVWKFWLFFKIFIFLFNPLTANDELSRHENLTFLWTWILRWVPRSFATHASLCNALSSNKLCPKTVKILAVKGLIAYNFISYHNETYFYSYSKLYKKRKICSKYYQNTWLVKSENFADKLYLIVLQFWLMIF